MVVKDIYRIIDRNQNTIFISSTSIPLSNKLSELKQNYKHQKGSKKYYSMFNKIGIDNIMIELLETYEYNKIEELRKKENEYKRSYGLNMIEHEIDNRSISSTATPATTENLLNSDISVGDDNTINNNEIFDNNVFDNFINKYKLAKPIPLQKQKITNKPDKSRIINILNQTLSHSR